MKREKIICRQCGKTLKKDEIALCRKLLDVDTEGFLLYRLSERVS